MWFEKRDSLVKGLAGNRNLHGYFLDLEYNISMSIGWRYKLSGARGAPLGAYAS